MITPHEFAEAVGRPYRTVMYWIRQGHIPGVERIEERRGVVYLVPSSAIQKFKDAGPRRGRPRKSER